MKTEQETFAANAYAELVHEIERKGAIASDRVKKIVMEHLGLQRLRRQRIEPILQRGVAEGAWDWSPLQMFARNPFDLTKTEEKDEPSPFGSDSTLTAAIKEAGLLTEGAPPITVTEATVLVTETKAPEVEEPVPVRKGVLDYTLRELLDAVLAHIESK